MDSKKIILEQNINSKNDYYELCKTDNRLSENPEEIFKGQFTNWIEYLSIKKEYYDLGTCKNKINEYLLNKKNIDLEITNIIKYFKTMDNMFPPCDLWCDYYNINDITELIKQNKTDKMVVF